MRQVDFPFKN